MHPQEAGALVCGLIYYITIPSMYMLLLIYSVFNMNDVSWGTREMAHKKVRQLIVNTKVHSIDCALQAEFGIKLLSYSFVEKLITNGNSKYSP